jgi:hypothetical protein
VASLLNLELMLDSYQSIFDQTLLDDVAQRNRQTLPHPV